jgi:hypothetical protein
MAVERQELSQSPWDNPIWPDRLPDAETMRLLYGEFADELVIRFDSNRYSLVAVVLVTTPKEDYAGLLVEGDRGAVIGVHVYPLVAMAVERHPSWLAAAAPNPPPEVARGIVNDIRELFDRYGIGDPAEW